MSDAKPCAPGHDRRCHISHDRGVESCPIVTDPEAARRPARIIVTARPRPRWWREAEAVDTAVYAAIAGTPTPTLDKAMTRLTHAANYSRLSLAASLVLATTRGARGRRAAEMGLASVAVTSTVANLVVKPLGRRRRPDPAAYQVPTERQAPLPRTRSFPSGHTAAAFAFATGVGQVLPTEAGGLRVLAALVGYSRIHTGVHYPGDVVGGALLGSVLAQVTTHALMGRGDD